MSSPSGTFLAAQSVTGQAIYPINFMLLYVRVHSEFVVAVLHATLLMHDPVRLRGGFPTGFLGKCLGPIFMQYTPNFKEVRF